MDDCNCSRVFILLASGGRWVFFQVRLEGEMQIYCLTVTIEEPGNVEKRHGRPLTQQIIHNRKTKKSL